MAVAKTVGFNDMETIIVVKGFIAQVPGAPQHSA
jgi:hypothetical protein